MAADFIGAKAAVFVGERLLVILRDDRPDIPCPDMWDFPGGGREGDETPEECLIRETREEVALDLPPAALVWKRLFPAAHHPGREAWFFVAQLPAAAESLIRLGDEGQDWRLMAPAEYLDHPDAIPSLQRRLRIWMAEAGLSPGAATG